MAGTLANCVLSGLGSFFMLGNLLNRAWIPAVSGGMTMTTLRLNVMAQYLVRPLLQAHPVALNCQIPELLFVPSTKLSTLKAFWPIIYLHSISAKALMKLLGGQQIKGFDWLLVRMSTDVHEQHHCCQAKHIHQANMHKEGPCSTLAQLMRCSPQVESCLTISSTVARNH